MSAISRFQILRNLKEAHEELGRAHTTAPQNSLHSEISEFRLTLQRAAIVCKREGFGRAHTLANWFDEVWYEKDYNDTKFQPVTIPQRRVGTRFDRAIMELKEACLSADPH